MKAEKICYKMVIPTKCVGEGGALHSLNKALFGDLPLALTFYSANSYHNMFLLSDLARGANIKMLLHQDMNIR